MSVDDETLDGDECDDDESLPDHKTRDKDGRIGRVLGNPSYCPAPGSVPPPGETIVEWLTDHHHTQRWLAWQVGSSAKHINQICNGHAFYTAALALRLAQVTGVSARFWMRLQADYQLNQAELLPPMKPAGPMPPAPPRLRKKKEHTDDSNDSERSGSLAAGHNGHQRVHDRRLDPAQHQG